MITSSASKIWGKGSASHASSPTPARTISGHSSQSRNTSPGRRGASPDDANPETGAEAPTAGDQAPATRCRQHWFHLPWPRRPPRPRASPWPERRLPGHRRPQRRYRRAGQIARRPSPLRRLPAPNRRTRTGAEHPVRATRVEALGLQPLLNLTPRLGNTAAVTAAGPPAPSRARAVVRAAELAHQGPDNLAYTGRREVKLNSRQAPRESDRNSLLCCSSARQRARCSGTVNLIARRLLRDGEPLPGELSSRVADGWKTHAPCSMHGPPQSFPIQK